MRRIYFLSPDIDIAKRVVNGLLLAKIENRHIHIIAKRDTPLEDLPEGNLLQKTDFIPAVEQGLAVGGSVGMLAGLVAIALPPASAVIAGGVLLGTTLFGAGLGAWVGGLVGMTLGNRRIKEFENEIEAGKLLVLVDVPVDRVEQTEELIKQYIPQAKIEHTEPKIPVFP